MKHTPGPWEIYHKLNVQAVNGEFIASCGINSNRPNNVEICEASARLIAAAPELLEACKEALDLIQSCEYGGEPIRENNYKNLQLAIAKVENK